MDVIKQKNMTRHSEPGGPNLADPTRLDTPEGDTFQNLVELAETIKVTLPPPEPDEKVEKVEVGSPAMKDKLETQPEAPLEDEKSRMARERAETELMRRDQQAFDNGRFSYYALTGQTKRLEKEKAPGLFDSVHRRLSEYAQIGVNSAWKRSTGALKRPKHYVESFDEAMKWKAGLAADPNYQEDITPEEFQALRGEDHLWNENLRGLVIKDLPPKLAFDLYSRMIWSSLNMHANLRAMEGEMRKSLEGFVAEALEAGDLETALDGNKRLGALNNPEFVAQVRAEIARLQTSTRPEDQAKLSRTVAKIREVGSS